MLQIVLTLAAALLIAATLLPISRLRQWWVRGLDFPRVQIAVLQFAWLLAYVALQQNGSEQTPSALWSLFVVGCLLWQLYWIWPYSELHAQEVLSADETEREALPHLRVITSNVLMDNRDAGPLKEHVRRESPDVLVTLESDAWWQEQLDVLDDYPHRIACPLDNRYGMHVYSRMPLHSTRVDFLVEDDIPSMCAYVELGDGTRVRFHVVHPTPPAPGENPRSTERDVELLMLAQRLEDNDEPTIVTGDLNDVAWSATTQLFRLRSGLLDPRIGRGMFNTFHAWHWYLRWPLDHMFVSEHFRLLEVRRLEQIGSDHFPVLFDVAIGEHRELESHPDADDVDEELERETLDSDVAKTARQPSLNAADTQLT